MKEKHKFRIFLPFIVSIIIVCIYTIWHQLLLNQTNAMIAMNDFMWIRFLLFWLLKLPDLKWFVKDFKKYDIIVKKFPIYGRIFPFAEIILWTAYLIDYNMNYRIAINIATIVLTWITSIWIRQSIKRKEKIDCVCMGTTFPIPMSNINFIENIAMWAMAVFMVFWMLFANQHWNYKQDLIINTNSKIDHKYMHH